MGAAPGMQRGYDAFNPDGRADYFCHPWNYEIKVGIRVFP